MQLPESAPFTADQRQSLNQLLAGLDAGQTTWLGGFLAGVAAASGVSPAAPATAAAPAAANLPVTVFFGTESGNSEGLAADDVAALKSLGFKAKLKSLGDATFKDFQEAQNALLVVSTWGDGEPPDAVVSFHEQMMGADAPKLDGLNFSVCALGDTSYEQFCECGKQFDRRLEELGANRMVDRVDCDVDFDDAHEEWFGKVLEVLNTKSGSTGGAGVAAVPAAATAAVGEAYGKKNPFPAPLLDRVMLNGEGSSKETWHIELGLSGSGMSYDAGDALALIPKNAPDVVESILKAGGFDANRKVEVKGGGERALGDALTENYDITGVSPTILKKYNELANSDKLTKLLDPENKKDLQEYLWGRQIVDVLEDFPISGLSAEDFTGLLRKLPPRLYSISSSIKAHPDEVHLTIASVRYNAHGRDRKGVASTYIADDLGIDDTVKVYTHANKNFKLPKRGDVPIIMVGPGTGVAPFRSFVEERAAEGAEGKSWLFFGDQRYSYDFLYQLEWQKHLKDGTLSKLDVAFSRDQKEKVYVQHKILEHSKEVFAWLEEGAHFYVCGDASRMANDVNEALIAVAMKEARLKRDAAEYYVEDLKKSKRYQRDVY